MSAGMSALVGSLPLGALSAAGVAPSTAPPQLPPGMSLPPDLLRALEQQQSKHLPSVLNVYLTNYGEAFGALELQACLIHLPIELGL